MSGRRFEIHASVYITRFLFIFIYGLASIYNDDDDNADQQPRRSSIC